jgi:hypothetical protein
MNSIFFDVQGLNLGENTLRWPPFNLFGYSIMVYTVHDVMHLIWGLSFGVQNWKFKKIIGTINLTSQQAQ